MSDPFVDAVREYIDFVNEQVGMYMDALAGFAGHHARVERQVARVLRVQKRELNEKGEPVTVWASYEDASKPDVIHNRIIHAADYLARNAPGGANEEQHARAILIFLFTYWEEGTRPRLAEAKAVPRNEIVSDIMGDLRVLRNVILHAKGILRQDKHRELKVLKDVFPIDASLALPEERMQRIFVLIKQDCARLLYGKLGVKDAPVQPHELRDIAIQRRAGGEST